MNSMRNGITVYMEPDDQDIRQIIRRPQVQRSELEGSVRRILEAVRNRGDAALIQFAASYDKAEISRILVSPEEIAEAVSRTAPDLRMAIRRAAKNIRTFHAAQMPPEEDMQVEPGVRCWRRLRPIERVGLYIPGGSAPLFSTVLMLAIPASLAGCREIVLATPPRPDGSIHPAVLYAASISGVTAIVRSGGAQAIAALAYGTESVPPVDKIFGPGNQYVTMAKELVSAAGTAIDIPAGPSEVMIAVDQYADPEVTAADMLSQAEHGPDSQVVVLAETMTLIDPVLKALARQLEQLPRKDFAEQSLSHSSLLLVPDRNRMVDIINRYAPEHLILNLRDAEALEGRIINAGSVFIGPWTPESAGDYASGTNHTLPTNGWARSFSGVSLDSFLKKITFQSITAAGLAQLGPIVEVLAEAESLSAHRNAVSIRLKKIRERGMPAADIPGNGVRT
jgi:histidinol dehydrogenase